MITFQKTYRPDEITTSMAERERKPNSRDPFNLRRNRETSIRLADRALHGEANFSLHLKTEAAPIPKAGVLRYWLLIQK